MNNEDKKVPPYFRFYIENCKLFDKLTDEQTIKVIRYIFDYVRGIEAEQPDDIASSIVASIVINGIDNAFKKYYAQCENGKKGGAPKGNKNAAKKKPETSGIYDMAIDEINEGIGRAICEVFYQAEKTNFDIYKFYKPIQIAEIITYCRVCDCDSFEDFDFDNYSNLKEATLNESATKVCKELKKVAIKVFEDEECNIDESFNSVYAEYKQRALIMLKFPLEEIEHFSDLCSAALNPDFYSEEKLEDMFTPQELIKIKEKQAETSQNDQT